MKILHILIRIISALSAALLLNIAFAAEDTQTGSPNDTVARDPSTGDWIYNFYHPTEPSRSFTWRYTPRNQIRPMVRSNVRKDGKDFEYRYQIRNEKGAKQPISYVWMRAPIQITEIPTTDDDIQIKNVPQAQWQAKLKQRYDARHALEKKTILAARGWDTQWHINRKDYIEFGWLPEFKDDSNLGIKPGTQQGGFGILRPELPGLAFAEMQGHVSKPEILGNTPTSGNVAASIRKMQEEDSTWTHVMVPAIAVPTPWNSAEFVRRIKAHVQNWVKWQAMTPAMLAKLNPKFDALIAAQESKSVQTSNQAVAALVAEILKSQSAMQQDHASDDDEEHWETPMPIVRTAGFPTLFPHTPKKAGIERIAARALLFDLHYFMERRETVR